MLQLVSSPFLFVYLAAQLRGGDPAAGEAGLSAMHSGKSSILVNVVHFTSNANIPLTSQFSLPLLAYIDWKIIHDCNNVTTATTTGQFKLIHTSGRVPVHRSTEIIKKHCVYYCSYDV